MTDKPTIKVMSFGEVRWRPIPDWPYEASSTGQIRRTTGASGTQAGRILKPRLFPNGYFYVGLHDRSRSKHRQVHALVAAAFLGRQPGQFVNHLNGDKTDNRVENLELTDIAGNAAHASATGLLQQGERHYAARLTADNVREIRAASVAGETQRSIAQRYGVSRSAVVHILSGKNWSHVS